MPFAEPISRAFGYWQRNGIAATGRRLIVSARRGFLGTRFVLFSCNLRDCTPANLNEIESAPVERKNSQPEIKPDDLQRILLSWDPERVRRQISERFALGASLWLYKLDQKVAAFGWTLKGRTVEPHFFPLCPNDIHFFDFFVFPEY